MSSITQSTLKTEMDNNLYKYSTSSRKSFYNHETCLAPTEEPNSNLAIYKRCPCNRNRRQGRRLINKIILLSIIFISLSTINVGVNCQSSSSGAQCPSMCNCIWRNGKQTAICESQGLISIPSGILSTTQVLNLNRNNFQILPTRVFQERGLSNLQKVFLAECKLGVIAPDAFVQLTNLVELYLSGNLLTVVPKESFESTPNLRKLDLHSNPISTVKKGSFENLQSLNTLDLSYCQIDVIEANAFIGLNKLQYLKLESNRLQTLSPGVVADLPSLYSLDLHQNPWNCDCNLRSAREWMIRANVPQSIPPTCATPTKLSGMMWNSLELDEFACLPQIITRDTEGVTIAGSSINFTCTVRSQPEARIFWLIDGIMYRNTSTTPGIMTTLTAVNPSPFGGNLDAKENNFNNGPSYGYQVMNTPSSSFPVIMRSPPKDNNNIDTSMNSNNYNREPMPRIMFIEEKSAGPPSTVSSMLIYNHVDSNDAGKVFICSAENSAGITSKNFTLTYVAPNSSSLSSYTSWGRMETGALIGSSAAILLAISVLCVYFLKFKKSDGNNKPNIDVLKNISSPLGVVKMSNGNGPHQKYGNGRPSEEDAKVINQEMMLMKIRPETGNSSGYGSTHDGVTPDITSNIGVHNLMLRNGLGAGGHFLTANQINQYQHFNQGFNPNDMILTSTNPNLASTNNFPPNTYIDASGNVIINDNQLTPNSYQQSYMYDNEAAMYDVDVNNGGIQTMMNNPGLLQEMEMNNPNAMINQVPASYATINWHHQQQGPNDPGVDQDIGQQTLSYNYVNYYDGVPIDPSNVQISSDNDQQRLYYEQQQQQQVMMNQGQLSNNSGGHVNMIGVGPMTSINFSNLQNGGGGNVSVTPTTTNSSSLSQHQPSPQILLANGQYVNASNCPADGSELIGTVI